MVANEWANNTGLWRFFKKLNEPRDTAFRYLCIVVYEKEEIARSMRKRQVVTPGEAQVFFTADKSRLQDNASEKQR
jgi:hypothetical protein